MPNTLLHLGMHLLPACPHTCTRVCPLQTLSNSHKRWSCPHSPAAPPSPSRRPPSKAHGSCRCTCRQTLAAAPLCECRASSCGPPVCVLTTRAPGVCANHTCSPHVLLRLLQPVPFHALAIQPTFPMQVNNGPRVDIQVPAVVRETSALKPCLVSPWYCLLDD